MSTTPPDSQRDFASVEGQIDEQVTSDVGDTAANYIDALLQRDESSQVLLANNASTAREIKSREQEVKAIYERLFQEGEHYRGKRFL